MQDVASEVSEFNFLIESGKKDLWNCRVMVLDKTNCFEFECLAL